MAFVIADLLKDWPCTWLQGSFNLAVRGVKDDSRRIQPGDVFVVIKGRNEDGAKYIHEAIEKGAVCIITENREDFIGTKGEVSLAVVPNTRTFLSHACSRVHGNPSDHLHVIAVTGTNGKTTVSQLIGQMLELLGFNVAVIGTLGLFINGKKVEGKMPSLTTWSASDLHETFSRLVEKKVTHAVIEASSMGLAQHRLDHCTIQQGVFLNIGHDHLDDHAGMEDYKRAKSKLLKLARKIVVNEDDPYWREQGLKSTKEVKWFGSATVVLNELKNGSMNLGIDDGTQTYLAEVPFTGLYNVSNVAAAIAAVNQMGIPISKIVPLLNRLSLPAGRFQYVIKEPFEVIIDYAHTPEALQQFLSTAAQITKGRLLVVFGCGGDRDQTKRSEMGEIAALYAQNIWVTSDNPRSEDPLEICEQIIQDLPKSKHIQIEVDRALAIEKALRFARPGDMLCIAGKGHESTQHIGNEILPFSDELTVHQIFSALPLTWSDEE